jgi:hypothetical protein
MHAERKLYNVKTIYIALTISSISTYRLLDSVGRTFIKGEILAFDKRSSSIIYENK